MEKKLTNTEILTILALAKNRMCKSRVARELNYSWTSIDNITKRVQDKTGLDPGDFYDMSKLIDAIGGKQNGN